MRSPYSQQCASLCAVVCPAIASPVLGGQNSSQTRSPTDEEKEHFLLSAKVIRKRTINTGITRPLRLTTTDDTLTHDVQLQRIDEFKNRADLPTGTELNFRDCCRSNISAYRLDRLLGLNMVPVSVERRLEGLHRSRHLVDRGCNHDGAEAL